MLIDGFTVFGNWPGLSYDHPVEHLINGMGKYKLDRACSLSSKGIFFDARAGNDATFEACQSDARLIPIGVVDPRICGLEEVDKCHQRGFKLMAMFPTTQEWSIDSLPSKTVLRRLDELQTPVMIEAGQEGDASAIYEATDGLSLPIILVGVSLPVLTETLMLLNERPHIYLASRLLCGGDTIEELSRTIGPERIIFTSRYPVSCFSSAFLTAQFSDLDEKARELIMGDNMARLINIS